MNHRREPDQAKSAKAKSAKAAKAEAANVEATNVEHHGYAPDVGRASEQLRQAGDLAFRRPPPGPQWPGREPSDAERRGVPATDTEARTPLGVGTSMSRRGERIAATEGEVGRRPGGIRGRARRPFGKSAPEHDTGVAAQGPSHEESPHLPTGDQAG